MPFASALSTAAVTEQAVSEVCDRAGSALGSRPDLAVLFFSPHHLGAAQALAGGIQRRLAPGAMLGCVAEAVIGDAREVEEGPALSLWLARWSRSVRIRPFHLVLEQTADGPGRCGWPDEL